MKERQAELPGRLLKARDDLLPVQTRCAAGGSYESFNDRSGLNRYSAFAPSASNARKLP